MDDAPRIAVAIPCYNEEVTVGKVIDDFRAELPDADIVVVDNNCTDATAQIAREHGARVLIEPRQGKGYAVEALLRRIDADVIVMVDGDDTYAADRVGDLVAPVIEGRADMVIGARLHEYTDQAFRPMHVFGNNLVRRLVNWVSGAKLTDILSGYRAFSRHAAQSLPIVSAGFEVETEMTVQALYHRLAVLEVPMAYRERPAGSVSKLSTFRDGFRVLWKIFSLFRAFKPLTFFGGLGALLLVLGLLAGIPPVHDYLTHPRHYVEHVPMAILATGLVLLSAVNFVVGILLHAINWRFRELHNVLVRGK